MSDTNNERESGEEVMDAEEITAAALNELKNNSVSKAEYLKLQKQYAEALETIVNGRSIEDEASEEAEAPDVNALRETLYGGKEMGACEYVSKTLELRQALIDNGETDPFLPVGKDVTISNDDVASADRVAKALKQCLEYANGDDGVFMNELQRILIDSAPVSARLRSR